MAEAGQKLANGTARIDFAIDPSRYRHWKLKVDGNVATLVMDVDEKGGLFEGYELKLNSYDLGVDIELADAYERIRFEHPQVRVVVLRSAKPRVFCAGANIRMPACAPSASSTALPPAAAMSLRLRPIISSWWMTARPPCRCPR